MLLCYINTCITGFKITVLDSQTKQRMYWFLQIRVHFLLSHLIILYKTLINTSLMDIISFLYYGYQRVYISHTF